MTAKKSKRARFGFNENVSSGVLTIMATGLLMLLFMYGYVFTEILENKMIKDF